MTSASSKALPYVSIAVALFMGVLASLGYGQMIDALVASLPILTVTAGGGLINKHIEASAAKYKELQASPEFQKFLAEAIAKAKGSS